MKDDILHLINILEYINRIEIYTADGEGMFMDSIMIQDAVIRNFENIGESTKQLSDELRQKYSDVPWRRIAGFRDILAHNYLNVDMDEVWNVVENNMPELKNRIKEIMKDLGITI